METIRLRTHVGDDGMLRVETPVDTPNADYDIVVIYRVHETQASDWAAFVDATYGILADDPLERPSDLTLEVREAIE